MKSAGVFAPGLLLGAYPERCPREAPQLLARYADALWTHSLGRWPKQRRLHGFVAHVRELQQTLDGESEPLLRERALGLRVKLARNGLTDVALTEAFAVAAVTSRRVLGVEPYDTQLFAARAMLDGQLAEMATGEGKTLAAALAAAAAALAGIPVHVVTANDYLVERDAAHLLRFYKALGLTVGAVTQPMTPAARREAYACDIAYCTAKELVFDYLRDSVAVPRRSAMEQRAAELSDTAAPQRLLRGLCMAVIDEADSLLIDEARVPLVLSQAVTDDTRDALRCAWQLSAALQPRTHFRVDAPSRSTQLTPAGRVQLRTLAAAGAFRWLTARHCEDTVNLALTARHMLQRGRDFVVEDGRVHIVDETTGRKAPGRAWSQGLHQLVEIKEGCEPSVQTTTLAQITYQRFFPRYFRLCGMSGTLREARSELRHIYDLPVVKVPLRLPSHRKVMPARVFASTAAMWAGVAARVREFHAQGRPVLIGTDSVRDSEALSQCLAAEGLTHALLNASQDRHEAQIIAAAGEPRAITVATNMAGRGTDILLAAASRDAGGLHVICCQQNASRRIDRQLMGRCARQGDPGSVERFIALEGPLLALGGLRSRLGRVFKKMNNINYLRNFGLTWLMLPMVHQAQRSAERRHRIEREMLMRQDRCVNDWFAFSGTEQ